MPHADQHIPRDIHGFPSLPLFTTTKLSCLLRRFFFGRSHHLTQNEEKMKKNPRISFALALTTKTRPSALENFFSVRSRDIFIHPK
jgi:hypothetical protein